MDIAGSLKFIVTFILISVKLTCKVPA